MLVLGSILAPSMLHTAFPAFPVVVPPSESRRMISTWHSHNCVFRQLLLTFLNSDVICDESQERWGHFALLVASIWSVDAKLWTLSRNFPTFTPATSFPFPICPVRVFCPVNRFLCINPTGPERRANPTGHIIFVENRWMKKWRHLISSLL